MKQLIALKDADYINMEDVLLDLKMNPSDMEIPVPKYLRQESLTKRASERKFIEQYTPKTLEFGNDVKVGDTLTFQDAVRMIQANERGRQGKVRFKFMADLRSQSAKDNDLEEVDNGMNVEEAVVHIQRAYRGHYSRVRRQKDERRDMEFLGMSEPVAEEEAVSQTKKAAVNKERRIGLQQQFEEEYQKALVSIKEKYVGGKGL